MAEEIKKRGDRKTRVGVVASDKGEKTIVVTVTRRVMHKRYKKYIKSRKRYMVHDEKNKCREGDTVMIIETKPISKLKRWKLKEIIEKAPIL